MYVLFYRYSEQHRLRAAPAAPRLSARVPAPRPARAPAPAPVLPASAKPASAVSVRSFQPAKPSGAMWAPRRQSSTAVLPVGRQGRPRYTRARRAVRDKIAVPEHKAQPLRRAGRCRDPAVGEAVVHRAQGALLKQGVCPAKDEINVSRDLTVVVILGAGPAGRKAARAEKAVLLPLLLRQRGAEQSILIAQQPHPVEHRPGAVHIGRDGLPGLCAGAGVVLDGQILHPQPLTAEKGGVAAEGMGGPPVRVGQLAAVAPYEPGCIRPRPPAG